MINHKDEVVGMLVEFKDGHFKSRSVTRGEMYKEPKPEQNGNLPMKKVINTNGITIRELKDAIKDIPEANEYGEEYEVWIDTGNGHSNPCNEIWPLNKRENGQDIILS